MLGVGVRPKDDLVQSGLICNIDLNSVAIWRVIDVERLLLVAVSLPYILSAYSQLGVRCVSCSAANFASLTSQRYPAEPP